MKFIESENTSIEILLKVLGKDDELEYSELLTDNVLEILIDKFQNYVANQNSRAMEIEEETQIQDDKAFHYMIGVLIYFTENVQHADMLI